jgi:hypothetical protein
VATSLHFFGLRMSESQQCADGAGKVRHCFVLRHHSAQRCLRLVLYALYAFTSLSLLPPSSSPARLYIVSRARWFMVSAAARSCLVSPLRTWTQPRSSLF